MGKIFGIGLSKTGTSSLHKALRILGFSAVDAPTDMKQIEAHDAATDTPVAAAFKALDARFPGSKFIYTTRELAPWLRSCKGLWAKHQDIFRRHKPFVRLHTQLYGGVDFDPDRFAAAYRRHEDDVMGYFRDRPSDLLVIDLCDGRAGWKELCEFLRVPVPNAAFPWANRGSPTDDLLLRVLHVLGGNAAQASALTRISFAYVSDLLHSERFRTHDPDSPLPAHDGWEHDSVIAHLRQHFGSVEATASALKIPPSDVSSALERLATRYVPTRSNQASS